MWIGSQTGLQRYDGTRFKTYRADIRDTAALQSDWIGAIFEDSKKRLWFGIDPEGPYTLNRTTGKFYNYNLHAKPENRINGVWHFTEDKNGVVWIAGHDGLYRLNDSINQFEKYNTKLGLAKNITPGWLAIDKDDNFWIGTASGIKCYNQREKKLYDNTNNPGHNPLFDINECIGVIIEQGNTLWVTSARNIYRYNFSSNIMEAFSFDRPASGKQAGESLKEIIGSMYCLRDEKLIVALVGRGLAIYQPAKNKFVIVEANTAKKYGYYIEEKNNGNTSIEQDRSKNIFIASDKGINIYNPDKQFFETHAAGPEENSLFPKDLANDFLQLPGGDILVAYYDPGAGIVKMDSNFQFKKQYLINDKGTTYSSSNQIWNLFRDDRGMIWAPNQNNTILKLNVSTDELTEERDSVFSGPINIIKQDRTGNTWMGHWSKGLIKIDAGSSKKHFYSQFVFSDSGNKKRVNTILPDGDLIWTGTLQNGLQLFDTKKEKFTEGFIVNEKSNTSISSNCVTDILQYNSDTLIIATLMGINIFDKRNKTFTAITARDGLPNNLVQTVMKDDNGNVWVACYDNGICKINMQRFSITSYDATDGNPGNIFTSKFYKLKNGTVLIGTTTGFISFNPSSFFSTALPADVYITGIHVFEKEPAFDSLLINHQPLELSYLENSLRIEFASIDFWNPGGLQYYYKLEGADKDWVSSRKDLTAIYNQLEPGHYVFNVKCKNRDGSFCRNITQLKININPPFWKTWWFRTLLILGTSFLIYGLIKLREKNNKAINDEKLKVQKLQVEQYKSKLELEQIINYFSSSLIEKNTIDDVLWDVAKNLIGQLGFVDCMIYLWNDDKTKMIQKAGFGPKDSEEAIRKGAFSVSAGQGVVGYVMQTKEPVVIADTSVDNRYRADDLVRSSELTVPIIYNNELLGVIDSEHYEKNFFTSQQLQILSTIATLVANKIKSIEAEQSLRLSQVEMYSMNEQLSKAKLEALRSQMNPHFIFNSLNAIQECILTNKVDAAYEYLSKFSKLQRMVLNNSEKEMIPLSSEIEMLQLYLSLESLRFNKSFSYSIDITGIVDADEIMIPSLITQPLVENAIWHGLRNKEGDKTLLLSYEEIDGMLHITIDDNGIGREKAAVIRKQKLGNSQFDSKGTIMLQQRLHVLSQQLKTNIQLETIDKKDEQGNATGTKVILIFSSTLETK